MNLPSRANKVSDIALYPISGGQSPLRIVSEFILALGGDPDVEAPSSSSEVKAWLIPTFQEELATLVELERGTRASDTVCTVLMPVCKIPLRKITEFCVAALEEADKLIGCKVVIRGNILYVGASLSGFLLSPETLRHSYELARIQRPILFRSLDN